MENNNEEKIEYAPEPDAETEERGYERVKKLKEEIEKCRKERDDYLSGWQRTKADLLNYRKSVLNETGAAKKSAAEDLIKELLPVLDSFDAALAGGVSETQSLFGGVKNIKKQLLAPLAKLGLSPLEVLEKKFNPEFCEAAGEVASDGEEEVVKKELQKGYALNGKIIRPARVIISVKK